MKAALFDLDGVVFDTERQYTVFWSSEGHRYHPEMPDLAFRIKGMALNEILNKYFGDVDEEHKHIVERLDTFETQMKFVFVDGFCEYLQQLKSNGVKTAIVTSSTSKKMEQVFKQHPFLHTEIDCIITADDIMNSKPSPECYQTAARQLCVKPGECIVFEDSFNGLRAVRAANEFVVGLATTNSREAINEYSDYVTDDYNGLDFSKLNEIVATYR